MPNTPIGHHDEAHGGDRRELVQIGPFESYEETIGTLASWHRQQDRGEETQAAGPCECASNSESLMADISPELLTFLDAKLTEILHSIYRSQQALTALRDRAEDDASLLAPVGRAMAAVRLQERTLTEVRQRLDGIRRSGASQGAEIAADPTHRRAERAHLSRRVVRYVLPVAIIVAAQRWWRRTPRAHTHRPEQHGAGSDVRTDTNSDRLPPS